MLPPANGDSESAAPGGRASLAKAAGAREFPVLKKRDFSYEKSKKSSLFQLTVMRSGLGQAHATTSVHGEPALLRMRQLLMNTKQLFVKIPTSLLRPHYT